MFIKERVCFFNAIQMFTWVTSPVTLLDIEVYEATGTVCATTGASTLVTNQTARIPFAKDVPLPVNDSPIEMNGSFCLTDLISSDVSEQSNPSDKIEIIVSH
ncbi:hypothetical protein NPIL_536631 [Nephila pilipes]|uniref:Uncharacterized protein n=1 Tax=Nephila pilipes TaxID=299642 RepID=A0A8X6PDR3_NEPPI|nr:hypothetical protein NPIL_536631 [Nephila pilipes]